MVRETPSFEKATKLFPDNKVVYCPDSAFGADLSGHRRPAPKHDVVKLLRQDSEKVERAISVEGPTFDWGFFGLEAYKWSAIRYPQTITERFPAISRTL